MLDFNSDINRQLKNFFEIEGNNYIKEKYLSDMQKIFRYIYMINYISKRIEFKNELFNCDYFKICKSCIIEAYHLIINNYMRGSALVLRSSLENFLKFVLKSFKKVKKDILIDDRSYTKNKKELDKIIKSYFKINLKDDAISLNSRMEAKYKKLSGISHSLVEESKNNSLNFLNDIKSINEENIELVIGHFNVVAECIFSFCILLGEFSFINWDSDELRKILRVVYGRKRTEKYIKKLKQKELG